MIDMMSSSYGSIDKMYDPHISYMQPHNFFQVVGLHLQVYSYLHAKGHKRLRYTRKFSPGTYRMMLSINLVVLSPSVT